MRDFANLYAELDESTSTLRKVAALGRYLRDAEPADAAWAIYFLSGGKPRQTVQGRWLREAARQASGIPEWLFEESYQAVGDLAETIAYLLPAPAEPDATGLATWMTERLLPLRGVPPEALPARLAELWAMLDGRGRFVMNKLITGGFRVGVSRLLVIRALAETFGVDAKLLAQRIIGYTGTGGQPDAARFLALIAEPAPAGDGAPLAADDERTGHPYPFFLAQQLNVPPGALPDAQLGPRDDWQVEWKWDGIRAQLVRRAGRTWLWSRGEELVTDRFPEVVEAATALPDGTVIDGEVLAWDAARGRPRPFAALQQRIGRKTLTAKVLRDAPVALRAYDLLEDGGTDLRVLPLLQRRARLHALVDAHFAPGATIGLSPVVDAPDWPALAALRAESRARSVEGFMLKRLDAPYGIGRTKSSALGEWWKWKIDPMSVDAVLIYAQRGHGRRASLYTDYTFAVWDDDPQQPGKRRLVPFAKAYSGLTDEEIRQVDDRIRRTTVEKFGPVRSVTPTLVFELGFEGIQRSPRHKSGIAVRFPRILRWRLDKPVDEADTMAQLTSLLDLVDGA